MINKSINQLCEEAFHIAKSKGWHDEPRETGTLLALIHSEVSEALEADRKGNQDAIHTKMEKNKVRTYKHGNKAY
ncbi:hypothetical protein J32TS6_05150 [Virgibacillus pantothenticus]|uniref:hypothetical protein n=1 Tax=Virgibacillus pantothenticus TaxID=1473 RepID=UPI001B0579D8|nr:hypothetical protein [Virgibacillus pantothenticus]GIP61960.1 hypothetical protein J32TS6_05150 [Virgibacillus pantothenticus]